MIKGYKLLHEGSIALAVVEGNGIPIDVAYLAEAAEQLRKKMDDINKELRATDVWAAWRKQYGEKANLGSRKQLEYILFTKMGIRRPPGNKMDKDTLDKVRHPFVTKFLELEGYKKALSTYIEGIGREVINHRLHPSFNLNTTVTYRSSSEMPNFQNIPIRNPVIGNIIRRCVRARKGWRIVETDFAGIEVKVAACYNKDPNLIKYIKDPSTDMHRDTACDLFLLKKDQVEKRTTRDWSKNRFVFPQFYGSYYVQCAPHLWEAVEENKSLVPGTKLTIKEHLAKNGIVKLGACDPKQEALPGTFEHQVQKVEKAFWNERFRVYKKWKEEWWAAYLKKGYFDTFTGFRCSHLMTRNACVNYPIQGSAFHCLLWCLIRLVKEIQRLGKKTLIIGQIHDSIVAEVPDSEMEWYAATVRRIMTVDLPAYYTWINVPFDVEIESSPVGGSWAEKSLYKE